MAATRVGVNTHKIMLLEKVIATMLYSRSTLVTTLKLHLNAHAIYPKLISTIPPKSCCLDYIPTVVIE